MARDRLRVYSVPYLTEQSGSAKAGPGSAAGSRNGAYHPVATRPLTKGITIASLKLLRLTTYFTAAWICWKSCPRSFIGASSSYMLLEPVSFCRCLIEP